MLGQYLPILALLVVAIGFGVGGISAASLLAPRNPNDRKRAPYECGIIPAKGTPERFPVRFFLIAMIFIVFDIEIIFFYPWAVSHEGLGLFGLSAIVLFSALVFESFVYLISNGALDWGPVKEVHRPAEMISAARTAHTTVRRVGLEGRADETPADESEGEAA
jgi:NADH-quinone oxidoreductase subunit A